MQIVPALGQIDINRWLVEENFADVAMENLMSRVSTIRDSM